ncbi:hypothetical protein [Larkinella terrae]|uniref:hypothetical protein n=1 Tax=Larkinella terrae TaxID=2025311 RepID=UPI0019824B14|nr:hypothetical protein [Larkinella terrae]
MTKSIPFFLLFWLAGGFLSFAQPAPRARDLGIPFPGTPGKFNAITDVAGVAVGYSTLIIGQGKNVRGKHWSCENVAFVQSPPS